MSYKSARRVPCRVQVGSFNVTVAVPERVVSALLVAVIVIEPGVLGAVKRPDEVICPALAVQVTSELPGFVNLDLCSPKYASIDAYLYA